MRSADGGPTFGLLPMQLHVGAAVGALALLIAHMVLHHRSARRRWPLLRRTDLTRRRALVGTGVVAGSAALWVIAPGLPRRATGSHEVGSGNIAVAGHAMDVRPGAPDRAGSLAPPNP